MTPTSIRQVMDTLNDEDRRKLMVAFENEIPQHIVLGDKTHYLGVHLRDQPGLKIAELVAGSWSYGEIDGN